MSTEYHLQNNPPMPTKQKRKRTGALKSADHAATKRRNQNRLSQQEHRRKQHAYINTMESFIETINDSNGAENEEGKYNKLLKAYTKLMEKNRCLEEMLNTMRSKLLSFASQLEFISESNAEQTAKADDIPSASEVLPNDFGSATMPPNPSSNANLTELLDISPTPSIPSNLQSLITPTQLGNDVGTVVVDAHIEPFVLPLHEDTVEPAQGPSTRTGDTLSGFAQTAFDGNLLCPSFLDPQPWLFPAPSRKTALSSATIFADEIIKASQKLTSQFDGFAATNLRSTPRNMVIDVAPAAVQVMGSLAGLDAYIYPTRFSTYLEHVIRWRISQSPENLSAVPEPFRPTPLQCNMVNHPTVIDFINWPSIRDQLILRAECLDLDTMCRDIVLNTVIDLRNFDCAVNIHDLLFNYILPRVKGADPIKGEHSMLHKSSWIYLQVGQSDAKRSGSPNDASTFEALARQIATRLSDQKTTRFSTLTALSPDISPHVPAQVDETALAALLSFFSIFDISRWRLGRDFARKYPYIDCASVVADFETVNCKSEGFRSKIAG